MNYWIFKYSPEYYNLDARLADPESKITWLAKRYRDEIQPGDTVFVWKTGKDRGIRAILKIDTAAEMMEEVASEKKYSLALDTDKTWRVVATIVTRDVNISHTEIRSIPELESLSVFHGVQQATNFRVTKQEGDSLLELINEKKNRG